MRMILIFLMLFLKLSAQEIESIENEVDKSLERSKLLLDFKNKGPEARVLHILLDGESGKEMTGRLGRALERANDEFVDALVLDLRNLETDISRSLLQNESLLNFSGHIYVYAEGEISGAATLFLLAADRIVLHEQASLAYASPKMFNDKEPDLEQKKELRSMCLNAFVDNARTRNHNVDLAQSLADWRLPFKGAGIDHKGDEGSFVIRAQQGRLEVDGRVLLTKDLVSSFDEFKDQFLGDAEIITFKESSSYLLAKKLMPFLPAIWIAVMIALFMEMNTPGFGVGGSLGSVGLVFCLFLQFQLGTAGVLDISLIFIGLALLAVEVVVLPGFGIAGILGIPAFGAGVVMSFINLEAIPENEVIRSSYLMDSSMFAMFNLSIIIIGTFIGTLAVMYYLPKMRLSNSVVLLDEEGEGRIETSDNLSPDLVQGQISASVLLHSKGVALTDLRPVGSAKICNVHLDVLTHGEMLDKGVELIVVEVEGGRVVVEECNE
jgi:membrane-bound serine protease (ClpP class)